MISNKIYIDNFDYDYPFEYWGEVFVTKEDFKRYSLQYFNRSDEYAYTDTTFTYNGVDYHLWRYTSIDSGAERVRYLLTTKTDFSGESVEDDITNDVCPYEYVLNEDEEMAYDKNTRDRKFILVKQIIEGNGCDCCQGTYCDSLTTIEFLNQLASGHCITVDGTSYSGCCGEVSPSAYCPTQSEIDRKFAKRIIGEHPEDDRNGFSMYFKNYSSQWPQSCCANSSEMEDGLGRMKKDVSFGYTEPYTYTLIIEKSPDCSSPNFIYKGVRNYKRYVVQCTDDEECGGEGGVYTSPGEIAYGTDYIVEGTFQKVCTRNGNTVEISFSPSSFTQNGNTQSCNVEMNADDSTFEITGACEMTNPLESSCTDEIISSTTISAPDGYEYTFGVDYPNPIPCAGGTISFYGDNSKCDGDVVNIPAKRVVPYNSGGETKYIVDESFSVEWDGGGCSIPIHLEINWETCGFHPDIEPEYDCSSYWYTEQWGTPENQYYYPNENYDDYKI